MKILDEYQDSQGRIYKPVMFTESYVYLRSDHYGSISTMMAPIRDGEVILKDAYGFKGARHNPTIWMQQNSEGMPQKFYSEATQQALDKAGICQDCTEQELRQLNQQRLLDSKKQKDE